MTRKVLVVDIGGTHIKILATGQSVPRVLSSGRRMTAANMARGVRALAQDWTYDTVAIGFPGVVRDDRPATEPHNLGRGWVGFDYAAAFGVPVRMINDAAMQALGSYERGKMLFLGLGTGLGSALVVAGDVLPLELAHLPYRRSTFEDHVGAAALERLGPRKWRERVADVARRLEAALVPDEVVLGGGNARLLGQLPPNWRTVDNGRAFDGGFRLWQPPAGKARRASGQRATRQQESEP